MPFHRLFSFVDNQYHAFFWRFDQLLDGQLDRLLAKREECSEFYGTRYYFLHFRKILNLYKTGNNWNVGLSCVVVGTFLKRTRLSIVIPHFLFWIDQDPALLSKNLLQMFRKFTPQILVALNNWNCINVVH